MSRDDRTLALDRRFDPSRQAVVATLAAGLDDQLERLVRRVAGLSVPQLEWRPGPGHNSVGMLLAHLAMVELWWLTCASHGVHDRDAVWQCYRDVLGLDGADDGIPQPPGGAFPEALRGRTADDYVRLMRTSRTHVLNELLEWSDDDLGRTVSMRDRTFSRRWMLYHVLEHFAAHAGGVGRLLHDMRDAGVLARD